MKFTIRGIQSISRQKPDGSQSVGINLFLSNPERNVVGEAVRSEYVSGNSEAYAVLRPYLANNVDRLIGSQCNIDFDVRQAGDKVWKTVIGFELLGENKK